MIAWSVGCLRQARASRWARDGLLAAATGAGAASDLAGAAAAGNGPTLRAMTTCGAASSAALAVAGATGLAGWAIGGGFWFDQPQLATFHASPSFLKLAVR